MEQSINTYWLQMEELTGVCRPWQIADRMGLRMGDDPGKPIGADPSFTLGTYPMSPLQMAQAYATFASRGIACRPLSILSLTQRNGKAVPGPGQECRKVLEPEVADAVNYLLEGVVKRGSGRKSNIGRPQAGKTGTTDERRAAWYVGYTPQLVGAVGIWDPRGTVKGVKLRNIRLGGTTYPRVQGANLPAPLWGAAMKPALAGIRGTKFVPPEGRFFQGTKGSGKAGGPDGDDEKADEEGRRSGEPRERSESRRRVVFPQPVPPPKAPRLPSRARARSARRRPPTRSRSSSSTPRCCRAVAATADPASFDPARFLPVVGGASSAPGQSASRRSAGREAAADHGRDPAAVGTACDPRLHHLHDPTHVARPGGAHLGDCCRDDVRELGVAQRSGQVALEHGELVPFARRQLGPPRAVVRRRGLPPLLRLPTQHREHLLVGEVTGARAAHLRRRDGGQRHTNGRGRQLVARLDRRREIRA
jgi:hypothetical protein